MIRRILALLITILLSASGAHATQYVTGNNTILLFTESINGSGASQAHVIYTNQTLSGGCGNQVWIDPNDKQIYATALAAYTNNKLISIRYDDSAGSAYTVGQGMITCKVVTIWYW